MGGIFLGKWWHWLILIVVAAVMWWAGSERMHVIHFNQFIFLLLAFTIVAILVLLIGTRPGEQVTRDDLSGVTSEPSDAE